MAAACPCLFAPRHALAAWDNPGLACRLSEPQPLIEIDRVTFGYDASRTILNDVSLRFARGKVTAILGGSGCGKTTLLRLIGGSHAPQRGEIRFDGERIDVHDRAQLYRLRRRLGMLFQFGALFTDLTCSTTSRSRCASRPICPKT
jgi:ABC-type transporter Mla maintaining outer membrane lipid asymmetry ATPase subunit MlaF